MHTILRATGVVAAILVLAACSASGSPQNESPAHDTSPSVVVTDVDPRPLDDQDLRAAEAVATAVVGMMTTPSAQLTEDSLSKVASSSVASELAALSAEREASGLRVSGEPKVEVIASREVPGEPNTIESFLCVDSSGITLVDASGQPANVTSGTEGKRVLQRHVMVLTSQGWVISKIDFPADKSC